MTAMGMHSMYTTSQMAFAGSADASASHTRCASAHAAFSAVVNILDADILASIFVMLALVFFVSLCGLSNSLVLVILVSLLISRHSITPRRQRSAAVA